MREKKLKFSDDNLQFHLIWISSVWVSILLIISMERVSRNHSRTYLPLLVIYWSVLRALICLCFELSVQRHNL